MNFQQINYLTDDVMPNVKPNTFKVIMFIARATWGWKKDQASLSFSDLQNGTGIGGRATLNRAIQDAIDSGFVTRDADGNSFCYRVNSSKMEPKSEPKADSKSVPKLNQNSSKTEPISKTEQFQNGTSISSKMELKQFQNGTDISSKMEPIYSSPKEYKEIKRTITEGNHDDGFAAVICDYENNIGQLTPMIAEDIGNALDEYGRDWITDAIKIAVQANVRKWNYILGILRRWAVEGKQDDTPKRAVVAQTMDGGFYA
jgi:DnaD/phage-associated family protein